MRQIFFVYVQLVGEFGLCHVSQPAKTGNTHSDTTHLLMKIFFHTLASSSPFEKYFIKKFSFVDAREDILLRLTGIIRQNGFEDASKNFFAAYVFITENLTGYNELNIIYAVKRFIF